MKTKKMLSVVLSVALLAGSLPGSFLQSVQTRAAETAQKVVVYVAAEGENASGAAVSLEKTPVLLDEGATASEAIQTALDGSEYADNYTISTSAWGDSLDEINGITTFQIDSYNWAYWSFYINGEYSSYGIGNYTVQNQDKISLIFTYNNDSTECSSYQDDTSLNPDTETQETLLSTAQSQKEILAQKIYEEQFDAGERIPGIEDAAGLYSVFSLAQSGFAADDFYDAVYNKICQQFGGINAYGKIYDETLEAEITFDSIASNSSLGKNAQSQYYAKIALCILALGKDPADVGGVNLYEKLLDESIYQSSSVYSRESMILFVLDAKDCDLPEGDGYITKSELVNTLLEDVDNQIATSIEWASYDSAAMAIQALAPYVTESLDDVDADEVADACDKVLGFLSTMQNTDGGYNNNVWTLAQVMVTMGCFGISAVKEAEDSYGFINNGKTVIDAAGDFVDIEAETVEESLMSFQPEQLLRGLEAVLRVAEGNSAIYNTEAVLYTAQESNKILLSADMISAIPVQYYTGTACTPEVTVTCEGKVLTQGTDYTVTYVDNNAVGTAYAIVTGKGDYALSQRVSFEIAKQAVSEDTDSNTDSAGKTSVKKQTTLKRPVIKKLTSQKKKTLQVKFKKVSGAKKYVVEISTNKKFKKAVRKKTVKKTTVTFKKLKSKKKYYVRVRACKGTTKSKYSKVKSKKVK